MRKLFLLLTLISTQAFGQIRNSGNVLQSLIADTTIDLYLEADRGILNKAGSTAFEGDSIGTWVDQSKSGKNATQNTSPRYPTLAYSDYNGRPCVKFAANGWLTNTSFTGMAHRSGQMTIVALRFTGQDNGPILEGGANGNGFPVSHASTKTIYAGSYNYSLGTYNGRYTEGLLLGVLWSSTNGSTNADRLKIFINGVEDTFSTHSGTVPFSSGIQTAGYNIGGASYTSEKINAEVYAIIHMRRAPTKAQLDSVFSYLREKYFSVPLKKKRGTTEGNSITEGYPNQLTPDQGSAWPAVLSKHMDSANYISPSGTYLWAYNANKEWTIRNVGARGETINTMSGQAASQVDGKRDEMAGMNLVVFAAGTNDLSASAIGGAQMNANAVYSAYETYCNNRRAAGSKVVAVTILDRRDQVGYQSTFNSKRDSVNTYIRANWRSFADALADVDADPRLDDASDAVHYYTGDQVHLEDTGCYVYAEVVRNAIRTITDVTTTFTNPMTTSGDMIIGGVNGRATRLGPGTNAYVLTMSGGVPTWVASTTGFTNLTDFDSQTAYRTLYVDGSGDVQELAHGTSGQVLTSNGTSSNPSWQTPSGGGGGDITVGTTVISSGTDTRIPFNDGGVYNEDADFKWAKTTNTLSVGVGAAGIIRSTGSTLKLEQTGATNGTTGLLIQDIGANFYNNGLDLVDFYMTGSSTATYNLRYDRRGGQTHGGNTDGEISFTNRFGRKELIIGDSSAYIKGNTGVGLDISNSPSSKLQVLGSFATAYVAKTANYTATILDYTVEVTANSPTITLPTAVGIPGRFYFITNSGAGSVTLATTSSQTFVNVSGTPTSLTVGTLAGVTVQSNGANWIKVNSF